MDVKSAFLHSELDEDLFMELPILSHEVIAEIMRRKKVDSNRNHIVVEKLVRTCSTVVHRLVMRLRKSIYVLQQAAKQWHKRLAGVLSEVVSTLSAADQFLFIADYLLQGRRYVLVYVGDIIIATNTKRDAAKVEATLREYFDIGAMNDAHLFLGMLVTPEREVKQSWLTQRAYIEKIAKRFNLMQSYSCIPISNDVRLEKASSEFTTFCGKTYWELVGSLMCVACCTRPDFMFATGYLARCLTCCSDEHWQEARRVLKYLVSFMDVGLCYGLRNELVVGYTDADWVGDKLTRKSTGRLVFMLAGA